jgi:hypothetical protein
MGTGSFAAAGAAYGFVAGTGNALIDGKNIGDALGGGAATATFGASIGTMLDTQTGSGTYTVGLNRKQVAVVHLVDFGDEPGLLLRFNEQGKFIGSSLFLNRLRYNYSSGAIVNSQGSIVTYFAFADPVNDAAAVLNESFEGLIFVQKAEIVNMLKNAGAFNPENKATYGFNRYDYVIASGKGGGNFDFSNRGIPEQYGRRNDPNKPSSPYLFLVDGVAHNHSNFGNFLFGAATKTIGFSLPEMLMGGQWNSLFNADKNGYNGQFDSLDDQSSIYWGYQHALLNAYFYK